MLYHIWEIQISLSILKEMAKLATLISDTSHVSIVTTMNGFASV